MWRHAAEREGRALILGIVLGYGLPIGAFLAIWLAVR